MNVVIKSTNFTTIRQNFTLDDISGITSDILAETAVEWICKQDNQNIFDGYQLKVFIVEKFKSIVERYNIHPLDILSMFDYSYQAELNSVYERLHLLITAIVRDLTMHGFINVFRIKKIEYKVRYGFFIQFQ